MRKYLEVKSEDLMNQGRSMMPPRIKAIRASYALKQDEFAELLNISYNTTETGKLDTVTHVLRLLPCLP